tara:strand:- start:5354 stop:6121 length:768 start_codon:yes stop_codon:yes gene_type:complete
MSKGTFVIICRYNKEKALIFNCLKSIRKHHPDHEIFVVDSDSEDKSYFDIVKNEFNVTVEDIGNKNYTTGAIWHMFNNNKRDYYYILHDSTEIFGNLDSHTRYDVVPTMISNDNFKWPVYPSKKPDDAEWNEANRSYKWAEEQVTNLTKFKFKESGFRCIGGCQILCNIKVLQELKKFNFDKILPTNKYEEECTERLWGFALDELGYTPLMLENALLKGRQQPSPRIKTYVNGVEVRKNEYYDGDLMVKYWVGRK